MNVLNFFGNQKQILYVFEKNFNAYGIEFKGNLLDVGCSNGGGLYTYFNSSKFDFIAGIDIDQTAIEMAKEYKKFADISDDEVFVDVCPIFKLPFEDEKFDFIIMKDIGEHLENKQNLELALAELKRVLKKEGYIYIETPNYLFPFEAHLEICIFPYFATKKNTKFLAKLTGKDPNFVDHLNFTTPSMFKDVFNRLNFGYKDLYVEQKLPNIVRNSQNLSDRFKFIGMVFRIINKMRLNSFIIWLFKITKMYPTLQYIAYKKGDKSE